MSVKKTKVNIIIPKYEIQGQLDFLASVCESFDFDVKVLIPLIFADWICDFQVATSKSNAQKAFISYLSSTSKVRDTLEQIKKYVENENENGKNNPSS